MKGHQNRITGLALSHTNVRVSSSAQPKLRWSKNVKPLLLILISAVIISGLSASSISTSSRGFTARLIHRSSPLSPFFDPQKSSDDIVAENHRITESREYNINGVVVQRKRPSLDFSLFYSIGTPPQLTIGIPDTGSNLIWMQCATCEECYDQQPVRMFDSRKSSTYKPVDCSDIVCHTESNSKFDCGPTSNKCVYTVQYMIGPRSRGDVARETLRVKTSDLGFEIFPNILFGCGIHNTQSSSLGIPGVIGLGNHSLSLVNQMQDKKFSFCQSQDPEMFESYMKFGEHAALLGKATPLTSNSNGHYHLILDGINVMSTPVNISKSFFFMVPNYYQETGFFLDTGSTYTYLRYEVFDALITTLKRFVNSATLSRRWDFCFLKQEENYVTLMPELTFRFRNSPITIPFKNAWIEVSDGYCLAIKSLNNKQKSIFGMYQMRGYNIGFDLDAHKLWISYEEHCFEF